MLVVKNNDIILRGARNQQDGLWDIPIRKTQLQSDNYRNPAQHGFLYSIQKTNSLKQPKRTKPIEIKVRETFSNLFSGFNPLIEMNECNYLCDIKQKIDTQQYSMARIDPSMNVILRKDKTEMNLAAYHPASHFRRYILH